MNRAPRFAIALLLVFSLAAAHGGAGLVRTLAEAGDGSYCCCPSPEECRCTANCCSHGPTRAEDLADTRPHQLALKSSISCRFPTLPDGSLSGANGSDLAAGTVARGVRDPRPPEPSGRRIDLAVACRYDSLCLPGSPRAPPSLLHCWC